MLKKIKIIANTILDHNGVTLEVNNENNLGKFTNMWIFGNMEIKQHAFEQPVSWEEIKREI